MSAGKSSVCGLAAAILILWSGPVAAAYGFAGGTGEPNDPYQIATAEQLIAIGSDPNLLGKHFVLVNDIDLDPNLPGGRIFAQAVIAPGTHDANDLFDGTLFTGSFDGAGFVISNLTVRGGDRLGLFGTLAAGAVVSNLGIEDANIVGEHGSERVGGLAGWNDGSIVNCHIEANITGGDCLGGLVGFNSGTVADSGAKGYVRAIGRAGGLAGLNTGRIARSYAETQVAGVSNNLGGLVGSSGGDIYACYARGQITGEQLRGGGLAAWNSGTICDSYAAVDMVSREFSIEFGGLVGLNGGTVVNCYALGTVSNASSVEDSLFGGLIGGIAPFWTRGTVINCFWDTEASATYISHGGMGLTTSQMTDPNTYSLNGWGGDPNWVLDPGKDYPRLAWEGTPGEPIPAPTIDWFEGSGTQDDPYAVASAEQLARIGTASILWDKAFVLASDLDLGGLDVPRIGVCRGTGFTGTFDGVNHTISNLTIGIESVPTSSLGLFGHIGGEGWVGRLIIGNATIETGPESEGVGILAGVNEGIITNCATAGNISRGGFQSVGLLVGMNEGTIAACSAGGMIASGDYSASLGGLVGDNSMGTIANCYATGSVSGGDKSRSLGGLVGHSYAGLITDCYAAASVSGGDSTYSLGGLAGSTFNSQLRHCYFLIGSEGGGPDNGLGLPLTSSEMRRQASFVDWDSDAIWMICEGRDYPRLQWENVLCEE